MTVVRVPPHKSNAASFKSTHKRKCTSVSAAVRADRRRVGGGEGEGRPAVVSAGMCWTRTPVAVLQMWKGLGRVGVLGSIHLSPRTLRVNLYSGGEGGWINNGLSHCRGEISDWITAYSTSWRPYDKNVRALHHAGDQPAATFVPAMRSFLSVRSPLPFLSHPHSHLGASLGTFHRTQSGETCR